METPLDQETARAEARTLYGNGTQEALGDRPVDEPDPLPQGLTSAEDDELRRLHWLSRMGSLAARKVERLIELRIRDRRTEIREPREFAGKEASTPEATTSSQAVDDLTEVRRQLEAMAQTRLVLPFDDVQRESYRKLLAAEQALIGRSKRTGT